MSRSGKPPQPYEGGKCMCRDGKPAMRDGIFCSDHELLWIAHSGVPSCRLKREYKKLYAQFMKMYRVKDEEFYRNMFTEPAWSAPPVGKTTQRDIYQQAASRIWPPRGGKSVYVYSATLRSLSEALAGGETADHERLGAGDNESPVC